MSGSKNFKSRRWYLFGVLALGALALLVSIVVSSTGVLAGRLSDTTARLGNSATSEKAAAPAPASLPRPSNPGGTNLVISQVYGGGGNSGATWRNDFVELFNPTNNTINFAGWSLQYASAAGAFTITNTTFLTGSIPAGGYYLVQEAAGANTSATPLPTPDAIGNIAMSATNA